MLTAIREVRRARGMTLEEVARACDPPTTAQTIGRLETGNRTVSLAWLNRIAAALGVAAADLVTLPERRDVPVAAVLGTDGAHAPRRPGVALPPAVAPDLVAVTVTASVGDYRAGDAVWCRRLAPEAFATAVNLDVLAPGRAGRFVFGRLIGLDDGALLILPLGTGARAEKIADAAWIARAETLIRGI